ncbi:MAG: DUF3800 domain-containing protein [Chloroflexi bacterium]|nr:DUF3800 domain-containing protein [Chloroflexota bacterium]
MLAFFDESGQPHPNDSCTKPVVVSMCIKRQDGRMVSGQLYSLKRHMGTPNIELKGVHLVTRRVFERRSNEWELVESFFDLCRTLPFILFAVVMEHPSQMPSCFDTGNESYLPNQYRYLLQRVHQYATDENKLVTLLFDGDGPTLLGGTLPNRFESFLYRSLEGQSFTSICEAPFYVDSQITQGIRITDMVASVVRLYQENDLHRGFPVGDRFLSAISRYYGIVRTKVIDLVTEEGYPRPGIYFMPERDHYTRGAQQGMLPTNNEEGFNSPSSS